MRDCVAAIPATQVPYVAENRVTFYVPRELGQKYKKKVFDEILTVDS